MIVFPNAKINIGLNIVERREDRYHNIESCFYPVPWYDALEVVESSNSLFSSSGIPIPGDSEGNLVVKAYQLLKSEFRLPNIKIHLHKNIPIGAGLGGGSADGAFMLKLLNSNFELGLSTLRLQEISAELGSDCAFFIENKPVYVEGTGNIFSSIHLDLSGYFVIVIYPNLHISTQEAYSSIVPKRSDFDLRTQLESKNPIEWSKVRNDFEYSLIERYPVIRNLKKQLNEDGAVYTSMTGSGSAVYGLFKEKPTTNFSFPHIIERL